ncbi:C-_U-editing enzyme APOBEC-1-like isoform X2 [Sceloporus undulatus]|nr:C->U-editing enzyme APOBEC-1-like isoform X2 [Sceloporus undulatus]
MEAEDFLETFNPSGEPEVTYLLYEIQWGNSRRVWRNWCRSIHPEHAEMIFLENEEIHDRPHIPCNITWFLTWTPCGACAHDIIEFLDERPNVTLDIRASQLYRPHDRRNRRGLRYLAEEGVQISIMDLSDYDYCWDTFVDHQGEMVQWDFSDEIWFNSQRLQSILNPF